MSFEHDRLAYDQSVHVLLVLCMPAARILMYMFEDVRKSTSRPSMHAAWRPCQHGEPSFSVMPDRNSLDLFMVQPPLGPSPARACAHGWPRISNSVYPAPSRACCVWDLSIMDSRAPMLQSILVLLRSLIYQSLNVSILADRAVATVVRTRGGICT